MSPTRAYSGRDTCTVGRDPHTDQEEEPLPGQEDAVTAADTLRECSSAEEPLVITFFQFGISSSIMVGY